MSTKQLILLDQSAIDKLVCPILFYNTVVKGLRLAENTVSIEFGQAFHRFRKIFRDKGDIGVAIREAVNYFNTTPKRYGKMNAYLTSAYLISVCCEYASVYEKDVVKPVRISDEDAKLQGLDSTALLEMKFAIPYYIDDSIEVLLVGTIDEISEVSSGIFLVTDCKTTSNFKIDNFLEKYRISRQLMFYVFVLEQYAKQYPNSIFPDMVHRGIGAQIDGIFLAGKDKFTLKRSDIFLFKEDLMSEFRAMIDNCIKRIIWIMEHTDNLPREGIMYNICSTYDGCVFFQLCAAPDKVTAEIIEGQIYKVKEYNPMLFQ